MKNNELFSLKSFVVSRQSLVGVVILRIATLNTWQERGPWRERWELIFAGLKFELPDIIGFQEVFNMEWAHEIGKRGGYPYLIKSGEHSGLIFLSKYPALESECITFKTKSPTEDYKRYAHYALFEIGNKKLAAFNTHLSWMQQDDDVRLKQTQELIQFVDQRTTEPVQHREVDRLTCPPPGSGQVFILGDFNSASNKPSIGAVQKLWEDSYAVANPGDAGLTWDYRNAYAERARDHMPERRIDYIWTKGLRGRIKNSKIIFNQPDANGTFPSDHFGVITEIEW